MSESPLTPEEQTELAEGLDRLVEETPHMLTVLKLWKVMLHQLDVDERLQVAPAVARNVIISWTNLTVQEVPEYFKLYNGFLREAQAALDAILDADPEALENIEDDGEANEHAYLNVMLAWNQLSVLWEHEWVATDADAHIQLAAMADAAGYLLGSQGMLGYLQGIPFKYGREEDTLFKDIIGEWKAGL